MNAVLDHPQEAPAATPLGPDSYENATPQRVRLARWTAVLPIVAVLLLATLTRLNHIDQPLTDVFSWRQSSTAMMAENFYRRSWNIFYPEVSWNGPGPTYQGREFQTVSYLAALIYLVVGQQEWVGRLVASTFGVWGVFALYQLIRRVWDEQRALAGAAVLAILPGAVFIDRSFLPDPAMVALATTTLWMLVAYLQTGSPRYLLLTGLVGTWALASKLPALLVALPALYAYLTILGIRRALGLKQLGIMITLALGVLVPVALYYLWVRELARLYPPYHFAGSGNWVWVEGVQVWWERGYYLDSLRNNLVYWLWTWPVLGLLAFGLLFLPPGHADASAETRPRARWFFHVWLAGCILYVVVGARELSENVWNFHIFNPVAAALAGHGLVLVASLGARSVRTPAALARAGLVLLVILVFGQQALVTMYKPSHAQAGYEMGLRLRELSAPDDLVVTMASDLGDPVAIYYSRRRGWIFPPADPDRWWNRLPEDDLQSIQMFEELRTSGARWLAFARKFDKETWAGHELLLAHFRKTGDFVEMGPNWVIYRIRSPEELQSSPRP
ncbi:MAG: glycosyltransferase family 39 protein [Chloroflexota bacterium]